MADEVERAMENMLPELEDLVKRELFSQAEIKSIIKKRRDSEYSLKRRQLFRVDYLRCIQYEMRFDMLRRKRKKRLGTMKMTVSDHAVQKRIHGLYNRALRRFRTDVTMWAQYINYCKSSGAQRALGRVYASALQYNPTNVSLWIDAAAWEYEGNQNMLNARALMQQSLRLNDDSQQLWSEYLRLELLYMRQIQSRQLILGVESQNDGRAAFLQGAVAGVVFDSAIQCFPGDIDFRVKLLHVAHEFQGVDHLLDKMYDSVVADFELEPQCYVVLANRYMLEKKGDEGDAAAALDKCVAVFKQGLAKLEPSAGLFEAYADMLRKHLEKPENSGEAVMEVLLGVFSRAEQAECTSPSLYCKWIDTLVQNTKLGDALAVAERALSEHEESGAVFEWWLKLLLAADGDSGESIVLAVQKAMEVMSSPDRAIILQVLLHAVLAQGADMEQVGPLLETAILKLGPDTDWLRVAFLQWVMTHLDADHARSTYAKFVSVPRCSPAVFQTCIAFERSQIVPSKQRVSKLYEQALRVNGHNSPDLWVSAIAEQQGLGNVAEAGKLAFRASKALKDPLDAAKVARET